MTHIARKTPLGLLYQQMTMLEERMKYAQEDEIEFLEIKAMNLGMEICAMEADYYNSKEKRDD